MTIRIVVADDHPIFLQALASVLGREKDFNVLAMCGNGDEALSAVREQRTDVLLLDYIMPGMNGLDVLRSIRAQQLAVRVVLLAALLEDHQVVEAIRLGVAGIFLKGMAGPLLIKCIRTVHAGGRWLERGSAGRALDSLVLQQASRHEIAGVLTRREVEIAGLIAQGLRNGEIAKKLFIDEGTVKVHLHNVSDKLNLRGRHALALYARDKGLA
jgi:two-component system nitrate/nitrite response regulator NarL